MTDKFLVDYWLAKDAYDEAERSCASAKGEFAIREQIRKEQWHRLVTAAEALPDESRKKVAAAQFCGAPRF